MAERPFKRLRSVSYDGTEASDDWPRAAKGIVIAPRQPSNTDMYVKPHRLFTSIYHFINYKLSHSCTAEGPADHLSLNVSIVNLESKCHGSVHLAPVICYRSCIFSRITGQPRTLLAALAFAFAYLSTLTPFFYIE